MFSCRTIRKTVAAALMIGILCHAGTFDTIAVNSSTGVKAIATSGQDSLKLKEERTVVPWGSNTYDQCDVPIELAVVTQPYIKKTVILNTASLPSSWAKQEIEEARKNFLLTEGIQDGFQSPATREEFCRLTVNLIENMYDESYVAVNTTRFGKTGNIHVQKAFELGILDGISAGSFLPDKPITRQEVAVMAVNTIIAIEDRLMVKYISLNDNDIDGVYCNDQDKIAGWAIKPVKAAYKYGIMTGGGGGNFGPDSAVTKETAIVLINWIFKTLSGIKAGKADLNSSPEPLLAMVKENGRYVFINSMGKGAFPLEYGLSADMSRMFHEGRMAVIHNNKVGYIDKTGKLIIPAKYDRAYEFSEGLAPVYKFKKEAGSKYEALYYGFVDKTGKEVIPIKYRHPAGALSHSYFSEGMAIVSEGYNYLSVTYGFINKSGKLAVPTKYNQCKPFHEGLAAVSRNGKWGFVDKSGKEIIPLIYEQCAPFYEGLASVRMNGKPCVIDRTGKIIVPAKYQGISSYSEGLAVVTRNGKSGYIDRAGKEVIPCIYDDAGDFHDGRATVTVNGKMGFIDKKGEVVIPIRYVHCYPFRNGMAVVVLNGKWVQSGFIPTLVGKRMILDRAGKVILPEKYDAISAFFNGLAEVNLRGKYGYIDTKGKEVVPVKYDETFHFGR